MLDIAVFKAEPETGMFKKSVEEISKDIKYDPLPADIRVIVIKSWQNFGLLPEAAVQEMVQALHQERHGQVSAPWMRAADHAAAGLWL